MYRTVISNGLKPSFEILSSLVNKMAFNFMKNSVLGPWTFSLLEQLFTLLIQSCHVSKQKETKTCFVDLNNCVFENVGNSWTELLLEQIELMTCQGVHLYRSQFTEKITSVARNKGEQTDLSYHRKTNQNV